jgi:hypothetical protein
MKPPDPFDTIELPEPGLYAKPTEDYYDDLGKTDAVPPED